MDIKRTLFTNGLWAVGGKLVSIPCAFALNLILAKALHPADFGAYFVALNGIIILVTIASLGMDQIAIRHIAMANGDTPTVRLIVKRCFVTAMAGGIVLSTILCLLSTKLFSLALHVPQLVPLTAVIVLWLFFSLLQRQAAETFRGINDIRLATIFGGLRNNGIIISLFTCLSAAWVSHLDRLSLGMSLAIMCAGSGLVSLFAIVLLARRLRVDTRKFIWRPKFTTAQALSESWPLWFFAIVSVLNTQGTAWLAGAFDGPENVALFGVAQRFVIILIMPAVIMAAILPPVIARMHHDGELLRLQKTIQLVAGMASIPSLIGLLVLSYTGKIMLTILFGQFYSGAYLLMMILCVGQVIKVMFGAWEIVLPMTGMKYEVFCLSVLSGCVLLVAGTALGYRYGVSGVAWSYLASSALTNLAGVVIVKRRLGIWSFAKFDPNQARLLFAELGSRALPDRRNASEI